LQLTFSCKLQPARYVGFGSMCGDEPLAVALTRTSLAALRVRDVMTD